MIQKESCKWLIRDIDQTGLEQWKHSKKWDSYCEICKAREELTNKLQLNQITSFNRKTNQGRKLPSSYFV